VRLRPTTRSARRAAVWTKLASEHGLTAVVPRVWPDFKAHTDKLAPAELEARSRACRSRSVATLDQGARSGFGQQGRDAGSEAAKLIVGTMRRFATAVPHGEQYRSRYRSISFVDRPFTRRPLRKRAEVRMACAHARAAGRWRCGRPTKRRVEAA